MALNDCIEETGKALSLNNQDIVKYLCSIEEERNNLELIIQKQYQERKKFEAEIERLTYKLCLINKSLSMRIKAKNNYDKMVAEIKGHYEKLVNSSFSLKQIVEKTQQELDGMMNKKIGTGSGPDGEEVKMLYVKPNEPSHPDECPCTVNSYVIEAPTKDYAEDKSSKDTLPFNRPDSVVPAMIPGFLKTPPSPLGSQTTASNPLGSQTTVSNRLGSQTESLSPSGFTETSQDPSYLQHTEEKLSVISQSTLQRLAEEQPQEAKQLVHEEPSSPVWSIRLNPEDYKVKIPHDEAEVELKSVSAGYDEHHGSSGIPSIAANSIIEQINSNKVHSIGPKDSLEKPGGALPEAPKDQAEDKSTNLLISRLRIGLNKMSTSSRTRNMSTIEGKSTASRSRGQSSVTPSKIYSYKSDAVSSTKDGRPDQKSKDKERMPRSVSDDDV